jgi:signal transduction histidine kinase
MRRSINDLWQVNKYLWITLVFLAIYIPFANAQGKFAVPLPQVYGILALAVVNGGLRTYCGWRRGGYNDERGWVFTIVDVALISLAVRVSGGLQSDLWLLYFVILISETLFAPPPQTRLLSVLIAVGYLCGTWPEQVTPLYLLSLGVRVFFLYLVGSFGRRLSEDRERRNQEMGLLREQVAASEERARIAREVHDGLGHALVASILRLELCLRLIRRDPAQAEELLREEVPALRAAWNEGRDLAGFAQGLRRHVSRFAERTGIVVNMELDDEIERLRPEIEMALMRIVQEALTNIAKHAQASEVAIQLRREKGRLHCEIRDNGVGFAPEEKSVHFGLDAMRDRAQQLGGEFHLTSKPGAGTTIEIHVPAN